MGQRENHRNNTGAFSWMNPPEAAQHIAEQRHADIVIIGAGHAGTCAARAAVEAGCTNVCVIEQQKREKQVVLGMGEVGHINSKWQASYGLPPVDIDEFVNDWQLRTNNRSDYALIRKYAEQCGDCFDWFIAPLTQEEQSVMYPMLRTPSPNMPKQVNGIHSYPGTAYMTVKVQNSAVKKSQRIAEDGGATFLFETKAVRLTQDAGRVCGVVAERADGTFIEVVARKGVILAAGDYSKNKQMCIDLLTETADLIDTDTDWMGHGWDGSGIQMGVWVGGRLEPRSHAAAGGTYSMPGFEVIGSTAVLRVNKYGERYSNEGFGTHVLAAVAGTRQPNGMLYGIFDENIHEQVTHQFMCNAVFDYCLPLRCEGLKKHLADALAAGRAGIAVKPKDPLLRRLYGANTIEELATYLYEDAASQQTFVQTVARYNALCRAGHDEDYGKDACLLQEINQPPYYAVGQMKDSHHPIGQSFKLLVTVSGLMIDENQQVLDDDYAPIPGLYATGNCSGGRFGQQYSTSVAGQSISIAHTLGREVGTHVAAL